MRNDIRKSRVRYAPAGPALAVVLSLLTPMTPSGEALASGVIVDHSCPGWDLNACFSRPLGIFFDPVRQETYVADTGNHQIIVCDRNGIPVYRFHHFVIKEGRSTLGEPKSIAVDTSGRILVVDNASSDIDVLDPTGRSIATIPVPHEGCGEADRFALLAIGPDGVYASLSCPHRHVAVIDGNLEVSRVVELVWKDAAERACITGLAVDARGGIFVTDACASEMVQMYDTNGGLLRSFGAHDTGLDNFSLASGIALMRDGNMWIVDTLRHLVSLFTPEGQRLATVGGKGAEPGELQYPSSVATDGVDRVFVVERAGNRYQCYRIQGEVLGSVLPARRQSGVLLEQSLSD